MRRTRIAMIALLYLAMGLSCAPTIQQQRYESGEQSQLLAEKAYISLYTAYKQGLIDDDLMAEADRLYGAWQVAQRQYALAAAMGEPDLTSQQARVQEALTVLLSLAADAKVL